VDIVITGRHTEVPDRFRRLVEEKLAKVGQLAPKAQRADVEWSHERNPRQSSTCEKVEITIRGKGPVIRAEASAEDPSAALDIALGKLGERLRRTRDRRKVHHGRQAPASLRQIPHGADDEEIAPDEVGFTDLHGEDVADASPVVIRDGAGRPRLVPLRRRRDAAPQRGVPAQGLELRRDQAGGRGRGRGGRAGARGLTAADRGLISRRVLSVVGGSMRP